MSNGFPNVPILGRAAVTIPAQQRLDTTERVTKAITSTRELGLRFGRLIAYNPLQGTDVGYLLLLDTLLVADCKVVSISEHLAPGGDGQPLIAIHVVFQLPESLFAGESARG